MLRSGLGLGGWKIITALPATHRFIHIRRLRRVWINVWVAGKAEWFVVNSCQPECFRDEYRTHFKVLYKCCVYLLFTSCHGLSLRCRMVEAAVLTMLMLQLSVLYEDFAMRSRTYLSCVISVSVRTPITDTAVREQFYLRHLRVVGLADSETVLQQNPPVLNWGCRLMQVWVSK